MYLSIQCNEGILQWKNRFQRSSKFKLCFIVDFNTDKTYDVLRTQWEGLPSQPPPSADNDLRLRWGNWLFKICNFLIWGPFTSFSSDYWFSLSTLLVLQPLLCVKFFFFKAKTMFQATELRRILITAFSSFILSFETDLKMQFSRTEMLKPTLNLEQYEVGSIKLKWKNREWQKISLTLWRLPTKLK